MIETVRATHAACSHKNGIVAICGMSIAAIADHAYAPDIIPIRVIPTCTDERKSSGLSRRSSIVFAFLFHFEARCSILLFFTETRAISDSAKNQFKRVRIRIIINSISFLIIGAYLSYEKPKKINYHMT